MIDYVEGDFALIGAILRDGGVFVSLLWVDADLRPPLHIPDIGKVELPDRASNLPASRMFTNIFLKIND